MAATPQNLLIPFTGGLDTYSNAHLLKPGFLTQALGLMLDRPGSAYAGPGYEPVQWTPSDTLTRTNFGIGTAAAGQGSNTDQLLLWSTLQVNTTDPSLSFRQEGPRVSVPGSATQAPQTQPLAPWRQFTQKFQADSSVIIGGTTISMIGAPHVAACTQQGLAFYVWLTTGGGVCLAVQNLETRLWKGPYLLYGNLPNAAFGLGSYNGSPLVSGIVKLVVACDSTYLRIGVTNGANLFFAHKWLVNSVSATSTATTLNAGNATVIDVVATGDEASGTCPGAFVCYDNASNAVVAYPFSGASAAVGSGVNVITGLAGIAPLTASPIRTATLSTGFVFATFDATKLQMATTDTALGSIVQTSSTMFGTIAQLKQVTIVNDLPGDIRYFTVAVERVKASYSAPLIAPNKTVTWASIDIYKVQPGAPADYYTTITAWGGAALMGKFHGWYNGADYQPLLAVRTGWFHNDGTWGTPTAAGTTTIAYPNGYLYDYRGTLYGRFGDADVGTNSLWPQFADGAYTAASLQPLPDGFRFNLDSGQQTLTYAWPQLGAAQFFSARLADSGSPIGAQIGTSAVTWLAPTASEPPAPMMQFGETLIIPGTITAYFDGANVFEAGFFTRSATPYVASVGGGGTLPDNTIYYYQTVTTYQDVAGKLHQSAPSRLVAVTTTAVSDSIAVDVPCVGQTLRTGRPIRIQLYRSVGNPGVSTDSGTFPLYAIPGAFVDLDNNFVTGTGVRIVSFPTDTTDDTVLSACAPVYTYQYQPGAATGTDAPPPFDSITIWNNQVWGVANRNGPELWCTWPQDTAVLQPEGPAWSSANRVPLPAEIGQPKGIAGLDEKLIIPGTRADYGLIGTAPSRDVSLADNPGLFTSPILLPSPGGMRTLNSLTRLPDGLLLQGTQGFVLLGRNLEYKRVGDPVNDFASTNLYLPGRFLADQQAVILYSTTDANSNLIYFYNSDSWSQVEQPPVSDISTAAAAPIVSTARGVTGQSTQVYALPSTGPYYQIVAPYSKYMTYRTPWIELRNAQMGPSFANYGMLRELQVLGDIPNGYPGPYTLTVRTEYDYANNTFAPPDVQSLQLFSDTQAEREYQWRFGFSQGNAIRVRFTVTLDGGQRTVSDTALPPVLLSGLMLSYDVDAGLSRLGAGNSAGT